jgi:hypothetical protein
MAESPRTPRVFVKREFGNGEIRFIQNEGEPDPRVQYYHKRKETRSGLEYFVPISTVLDLKNSTDPELSPRPRSKSNDSLVPSEEVFDFGNYRVGHLVVTISGIFIPFIFFLGFPIFFALLNVKMFKENLLRFRNYRKVFYSYTAMGWVTWTTLSFALGTMLVGLIFDDTPIFMASYVLGPIAIGLIIAHAIVGSHWLKGPCCNCYEQ